MNLGILSNFISFIVLIYFIIQYMNTKKFIYKLPVMTRSKYIGLEILSKRVLIVDIVLFALSIIFSNMIFKVLVSMIIIFTVLYAVSELNILKEYIGKNKSRY